MGLDPFLSHFPNIFPRKRQTNTEERSKTHPLFIHVAVSPLETSSRKHPKQKPEIIIHIDHIEPSPLTFFHNSFRLDPNFTSVPDLPQPPSGLRLRFSRSTAEALRLCNEEIDRRALFPPVSTALLVLTAGVSENLWDEPGRGGDMREDNGEMMKTHTHTHMT